MPELTHYRLGQNPELEAVRTKALYLNPGTDEAVEREFSPTADAYRTLPLVEIAKRISAKYKDLSVGAIGFLAVLNTDEEEKFDIGMSWTGIKDVANPHVSKEQLIPGVNVSGWVLSQYRGHGYGREILAYTTGSVRQIVEYSPYEEWHGRQIWTSIRPDNIASRRACEAIGFVEVGVQVEKPDRLLYFLDQSLDFEGNLTCN